MALPTHLLEVIDINNPLKNITASALVALVFFTQYPNFTAKFMWTSYQTFTAGIAHITELGAYDHMCYLVAMVAGLSWMHWKKLLALASAFTLGHSITLVLGGLNIISFSSDWVETLIAASIFISALLRLINKTTPPSIGSLDYAMNAAFGLIHGMGFSQTIRIMIDDNSASEHIQMLFLFNCGVEVGQVVVIAALIAVTWLLTTPLNISAKRIQMALAGLAAAVGLFLFIDRLSSLFA